NDGDKHSKSRQNSPAHPSLLTGQPLSYIVRAGTSCVGHRLCVAEAALTRKDHVVAHRTSTVHLPPDPGQLGRSLRPEFPVFKELISKILLSVRDRGRSAI